MKILICILIVVIVLGLVLFSIFHIRAFKDNKQIFDRAKLACENKVLEDNCAFVGSHEVVVGVCEEFGNQGLCCKAEVEKPISLAKLNPFDD